jgi:hypothetical protein
MFRYQNSLHILLIPLNIMITFRFYCFSSSSQNAAEVKNPNHGLKSCRFLIANLLCAPAGQETASDAFPATLG